MTLEELYQSIGADYEQATRVLRVDKLIDKHIRKFAETGVVERLVAAGRSMDPTALFESSHAMKGVCANLGLTGLADAASEIAEEFRPGNSRALSDEQVAAKIEAIDKMYERTIEGIRLYEQS